MTARQRTALRLKRALRHMRPRHIVATRLTKRTIATFADKVGLVYFGHVDQRDDEHRLIRGHTVSATHVDNHYCIGTVRGYDVMLVLRNDIVKRPSDPRESRCHWLILTIDLRTKTEIPHFYIGHRSRDVAFAASYEQLYPLAIGGLGAYPHQFISDYTVYGRATHTLDIERTITPQMAMVIASHFVCASIEVEENTVYLYIESERPDEALLEKILSNGLWLAESIDANYSTKVEPD